MLREVTKDNVRDVIALEVAQEQSSYVATNAKSIAEAHFEPKAWFRAIGAGDALVGFAMVYRDPTAATFYIWRFMIDARHQGRGYGRRAMEHWRRWLPARYRSITDPEAFFSMLGRQAESQILDLAEQLEGPDLPGEGYRNGGLLRPRAASRHPPEPRPRTAIHLGSHP